MAKEFVGQEYMAATHGKGLHQQSKGDRILARTTITLSTVITIISAFIVFFCICFQLCPVRGSSMMTTLNATAGVNSDSALTTVLGTPERGDIVVVKLYLQNFNYKWYVDAANGDEFALSYLRKSDPYYTRQKAIEEVQRVRGEYDQTDDKGYFKYIVKRLIAKPGDIVSMRAVGNKYYIYLNGEKLDESYLDPLVSDHDAPNFRQLWNILNQTELADLQHWVSTECKDGKLLFPNTDQALDGDGVPSTKMLVIPDGYYFLMGDNRGSLDNVSGYQKSWDSTSFGPLPVDNYYGHCVDILDTNTSMPNYLWKKFVYYVCFGWAWQK